MYVISVYKVHQLHYIINVYNLATLFIVYMHVRDGHGTRYNQLVQQQQHNKSKDPDSLPIDFSDCYDDDTRDSRRMMHNCGFKAYTRGGAEFSKTHWPKTID